MLNYDYEVPLPGMYIQEELDARGWSQRDLAFILGMQEPDLNKIIKGKTGVSFEMSKALAKAFDVDPDFFANLQKAYDFAHSREPDPAVEQRATLQKVFPVREMIKRAWLKNVGASELEGELATFFRAANSNQIADVAHAARKTNSGEPATPTQLAWLYRVRQIAEQIPCKPYSASGLVDGQHRLHALMSDAEEIRHVPNFFAEYGVRFILVEGLSGGKIDGVCFWLDSKSPVIGMSVRFDRIDNFWFVLRHEYEHVLRRHGQQHEIIDVNVEEVSNGLSQEETQANDAAAEFCVPQEKLKSFIARKSPLISERDVMNFAKMVGVHPGIVVGQLQKKTGRWDFLKRQQVKIRHLITRTAIVDGWGQVAPVH
jgi:HTH-type transcriptional regulator / antitoxin HigA